MGLSGFQGALSERIIDSVWRGGKVLKDESGPEPLLEPLSICSGMYLHEAPTCSAFLCYLLVHITTVLVLLDSKLFAWTARDQCRQCEFAMHAWQICSEFGSQFLILFMFNSTD